MQPQEVEVWYILPAIRKALAKALLRKFQLTQKKVSELLQLQESTVSQYIKEKRGNQDIFDEEIQLEIDISAQNIHNDSKTMLFEIQRICALVKEKGILCKVHKCHEQMIEGCGACLK